MAVLGASDTVPLVMVMPGRPPVGVMPVGVVVPFVGAALGSMEEGRERAGGVSRYVGGSVNFAIRRAKERSSS